VLVLARQIRERLTTLAGLVDRLKRAHRPADLARVVERQVIPYLAATSVT